MRRPVERSPHGGAFSAQSNPDPTFQTSILRTSILEPDLIDESDMQESCLEGICHTTLLNTL